MKRLARSRKAKSGLRTLFGGKAPPASEVGDRLVRLAKRMLRKALIDASPKRITLSMHPFAAPARIAVLPDGDLELYADVFGIGPAYHHDIIARLTPLVDELDYVWADDARDPAITLTNALRDRLQESIGKQLRLAMPADREFIVDAPVLTAMGPRDLAWRDAVLADPMQGTDAFVWWRNAPGHRERADALLAMWHEVPWRMPLDADERALLRRVDDDLRCARAASPAIDLPYPEWSRICDYLKLDDEIAADVRARGAALEPAIGYRRYDVLAEVEGWSLEMPGSFLGGFRDDIYIATDGERSIEVATLSVDDESQSIDALLAVAPERFPVIARSPNGRAEAYDEDGKRVIHGIVVAPPHVAIVTCKGSEAWGLATWKSLRR